MSFYVDILTKRSLNVPTRLVIPLQTVPIISLRVWTCTNHKADRMYKYGKVCWNSPRGLAYSFPLKTISERCCCRQILILYICCCKRCIIGLPIMYIGNSLLYEVLMCEVCTYEVYYFMNTLWLYDIFTLWYFMWMMKITKMKDLDLYV